MDAFEGLQKLGLSEKATRTYLTLFGMGSASAGELAQRTGIHRRSGYDALTELQEKGLVSYSIKERTKIYQPASLSSFRALVREHEALVEEVLSKLQKIGTRTDEPLIEIFKGTNAAKGVFEDTLKTKETIYIYGGDNPARRYLKNYYPKYTQMRAKLGVPVKAIQMDTPETRKFVHSLPLWKARFIDKKLFPSIWWVQGKRVFLVFWKEEPSIIRITDSSVSKTYLDSFRMLWKTAKK